MPRLEAETGFVSKPVSVEPISYRRMHFHTRPGDFPGVAVKPPRKETEPLLEVRFADLDRDAEVVAKLLTQPSAIVHLGGITPDYSAADVRSFYKTHPDQHLLVATSPEGEVVGTVTVQEPSFGAQAAQINKLAVSEDYRRQGVGKALLDTANAYIFSPVEEGGLGCQQALAFIIHRIKDSDAPRQLFETKMHYRQWGDVFVKRARAWSHKVNDLVARDVVQMVLTRSDWLKYQGRDRARYFPKQLPQQSIG